MGNIEDIKTVCAWCLKVLQEPKTDDYQVSHGICQECSEKLIASIQPK